MRSSCIAQRATGVSTASVEELKDSRNVICLGRLNDKKQLIATRIDVRDEK